MWIDRLEEFKHQHISLPKDTAMLVPRTNLMAESDWRNLSIQQSQEGGDPWTSTSHLTTILEAIIQEAKETNLWATFQHQALDICPYSHVFLTAGLYSFLLTSIFKGRSIHCLNVLVPALLLESSQQCHSPVRCVWLQSHSVLHIQQATSATLSKCPRISSWLLQGKYEFVVVVFLYWVLYLWWLMDLHFNILETFHFTWQICYMLYKLD